MKKSFIFTALFLLTMSFMTSGCAWIVAIMTANEMENYDSTQADQGITEIEKERQLRMIKNDSYRTEEINAINDRAGTAPETQSKSLSLEELKEQQARERERRAKQAK